MAPDWGCRRRSSQQSRVGRSQTAHKHAHSIHRALRPEFGPRTTVPDHPSPGRRGHQVTLASLWSSDEDRSDLDRVVERSHDHRASVASVALDLQLGTLSATRDPVQSSYCWQPALADDLVSFVGHSGVSTDVIHVDTCVALATAYTSNQGSKIKHQEFLSSGTVSTVSAISSPERLRAASPSKDASSRVWS